MCGMYYHALGSLVRDRVSGRTGRVCAYSWYEGVKVYTIGGGKRRMRHIPATQCELLAPPMSMRKAWGSDMTLETFLDRG
jgi:hypothetical protein